LEVGKLSWLSSHEAGGVAPSENPESPGSSSEARWASSLEGRNQDPELDGPGAAKSAEKFRNYKILQTLLSRKYQLTSAYV